MGKEFKVTAEEKLKCEIAATICAALIRNDGATSYTPKERIVLGAEAIELANLIFEGATNG